MLRFIIIIFSFQFLIPLVNAVVLDAPETIKLTFDISNNHLQIYWTPSSSNNFEFYEVWYPNDSITLGGRISSTPVPNTRIDTTVFFKDFEFNEALWYSMGFYVRARVNSGKDESLSWPDVPCDSTVFLKAIFDSCSSNVTLEWNDYHTWRGKITGCKIFGSVNGIDYREYGQVNEGTGSYIISNIGANELYRFYIKTTNLNTGDSVFSNRVDINTGMSVNPSFIHADYGSVNSNHPFVRFSVDPVSELSGYVLLRAESPTAPFDSIAYIQSVNDVIEYRDEEVNSSQQPYYYKLNALNYCDQIIRTSDNIAGTIYLQASTNGQTVDLSWNEYFNWITGVSNYTVERKINDQIYTSISSTNNFSYSDNSFQNQGEQMVGSELCYRIMARENINSQLAAISLSNEVCISLEMNVRFEYDAFIPGSADNNTFGPTMDFIPESIKFSIYNRWGNQLFESTDPYNLRWNGSFNGEPVDQGVYRYQLEYKNENGKINVIHGNVTIVYP